MKRSALNQKGLTLLEIIIALVLVGMVSAVVGLAGSHLVKGFLFSEKNADTLLKGQVAMARIVKELNNIKVVHTNAGDTDETKIKFTSYRDDAVHTIALDATDANNKRILLDNEVLTDSVSSFSLSYYANYTGSGSVVPTGTGAILAGWIIEINLALTGAENVTSTFSERVLPSFPATTGY